MQPYDLYLARLSNSVRWGPGLENMPPAADCHLLAVHPGFKICTDYARRLARCEGWHIIAPKPGKHEPFAIVATTWINGEEYGLLVTPRTFYLVSGLYTGLRELGAIE